MQSSCRYQVIGAGKLILLALPLSFIANIKAAEIIAPVEIAGSTKVDAEMVIRMVQEFPDLLIIDARIRMDRQQGYIESSISLPDVETDCDALAKVINSKSSKVLFYCNGPKCGRSGKSVEIAIKCGYAHIFWFRGGFEEWKLKGYPYLRN